MDKIWKGSPNFFSGRAGYKPEAIVIHIMAGTLVGTDSWFNTPSSQVSAHYGIGKNGEVHQYVKDADRAWHAGRVQNPTAKLVIARPGVNPNNYTIGIEHEGGPTDAWTPEMKQASAALIRELCATHGIPVDREHIFGHYEVFSGKPDCPAKNKGIIDELVTLAKGSTGGGNASLPPAVANGIAKVEEGLEIIRNAFKN